MEKIILYTIDCPACLVLEKKLNSKNIQFEKVTDVETFLRLELDKFPVLRVNNKMMPYGEAVKWVNNYEN